MTKQEMKDIAKGVAVISAEIYIRSILIKTTIYAIQNIFHKIEK